MIDVNIIENKMLSLRVHGLRRIIAEKLQLCILSALIVATFILTINYKESTLLSCTHTYILKKENL